MKPSLVLSLSKGIQLLDVLAQTGEPKTLQELAVLTGWPKSTIHGLLTTLRHHRLVQQETETGRYGLGLHLFELGGQVSLGWRVLPLARPIMRQIAQASGATVQLVVYQGESALVIESVLAGTLEVQVQYPVGLHLPLYCTALGKAVLAQQPAEQIEAYLSKRPLLAHTPHTLIQPEALKQQLRQVNEQGWALEDGEHRIGLRAMAASLSDPLGGEAYAIGVTGLYRHRDSAEMQRCRERLLAGARQLSLLIRTLD